MASSYTRHTAGCPTPSAHPAIWSTRRYSFLLLAYQGALCLPTLMVGKPGATVADPSLESPDSPSLSTKCARNAPQDEGACSAPRQGVLVACRCMAAVCVPMPWSAAAAPASRPAWSHKAIPRCVCSVALRLLGRDEAELMLLIFLLWEQLLFGSFTALMLRDQLTSLCADRTAIERFKQLQAAQNSPSDAPRPSALKGFRCILRKATAVCSPASTDF